MFTNKSLLKGNKKNKFFYLLKLFPSADRSLNIMQIEQ